MKSLLIVISIHHNNTRQIADAMAKVLDAQLKNPQDVKPEELQDYNLVGFGSGIYGEKHHESLLELADKLPQVSNKIAFLFSTAALTNDKKVINDHSKLREKLQLKGYIIFDDFQCKGFNTNSFMKYFGGMNKGRPNAEDLKNAEEFAQNLKQKLNVL
jgi:flavodoxin